MAIPPPPGPQQPGGPHPQGPQQQPYGYGPPYQPWGQGYSPYNRPAPVNGLAIAALVLGILCFLPAVGLILGVIALVQIKRRGERGRGLAVGGIVMSSLGVVLLAIGLLGGGAYDAWEGFKEGVREAGGSGAPFSVKKGECFNAQDGSLEGMAYDVDKVPCSGEHQAEVFAGVLLPDGRFPGDDAVAEKADDRCYALLYTYAMDSWAIPDDVDVYYFTPTRESWALGDREITCMFGNTDAKGTLTGSLRRDASSLTADQLAYLRADAVLYGALNTAPDTENLEDDLKGDKEWAARVATALKDQTGRLRAHTWQDGAERPVSGQADALDRAREEWRKAAQAADVDAFHLHYERGSALLEGRAAVTARKALGLATTPPSPGAEADGDGAEGTGDGKQV
ncbi:DUF4190 domain-containing protein [Streptomyces nodosus]|uniref:DUF4190 domain-containing protein n=1 Tax=Streptomyces nodosus TaxID=40318 RepID=A0A5P2WBW0_9ACTN|nr:DUF4190 domain-containing protein [Streptomyces nodosus]MBB4793610.1 hypothetical protein [Streptomyces nodosus]QEV40839.1 DUF4190 domain-containing protein [Streptomyces nodosus]